MAGDDTSELVRDAVAGDDTAVEALFSRHRARLRRMIALRLTGPLQRRLDASDVLQDVYVEASRRLEDYQRKQPCPFYLWLRMIAGEKIIVAYRHHQGALRRAIGRELALDTQGVPVPDVSSLVFELSGSLTTPSGVAMRHEQEQRLRAILNALPPGDRDILVLRHLEQLSNQEIAHVLQTNPSTASTRYVRALKRLRESLAGDPEFREDYDVEPGDATV